MAGIFGSTNNIDKPTFTGIQLQTSAADLAIPIAFGTNKLGCNLIQYENFNTFLDDSDSGGKGGLFGGSSGQGEYHYTADVVLAICEGPIHGVNLIWKSGQITSITADDMVGFILEDGDDATTQAPFGFLESDAPTRALAYQDTAVAGCQALDMGTTPTLPQFEWEVEGFFSASDAYAPPPVTATLVASVNSGDTVLFVDAVAGIYRGMTLIYDGQTPLDYNGKPLNTPYYVEVVGVNSTTKGVQVSAALTDIVTAQLSDGSGGTAATPLQAGSQVSFRFLDVNPRNVLQKILLGERVGLNWDASLLGDLTQWSTYCQAQGIFISPIYDVQEQFTTVIDRLAQETNSWIFYDGTQVQAVPLGDTTIFHNGTVFTPRLAAAYDLDYDDFVFDEGQMPVEVDRKDPSDAYNQVRIEINDRVNKGYQSNPVEAKDQGMIGQFGQVNAPSIQGRDICSPTVGNTVVNLLLARYVYIRNDYVFKLGPEFSLLQVGDIVTLTEPHIGLVKFPVRIKQVDEDDKMIATYTAEEVPGGVQVVDPDNRIGTQQDTAGSAAPASRGQANPGSVNAPVIFEPSSALSGTPQVWLLLSGASAAWGGCDVYVSTDGGTDYSKVGSVTKAARQGPLTAALPLAADPDLSGVLQVDLTESSGTVSSSVSHADADAFRSVVYAGGEIIAYGAAALVSGHTYSLSYLRRGLYGTASAAHAIGAAFAALDGRQFVMDLPRALVGTTLHFKFPSFNTYGASLQDLSSCTDYTYTPSGFGYDTGGTGGAGAVTAIPSTPAGLTALGVAGGVSLAWTALSDPTVLYYQLFRATGRDQSFPSSPSVLATTTSPQWTDASAQAGTWYTYFVAAVNAYGDSPPSAGQSASPDPVTSQIAAGHGGDWGQVGGATNAVVDLGSVTVGATVDIDLGVIGQ